MADEILLSRNGCALHGALKVLGAVNGFQPIVHSSAGCSIQNKLASVHYTDNAFNAGWLETPATNLTEKQVVFGGTARLREQIKNTVKIHEADLYIVVTGCVPELVGDDVPAMVKEAQDQAFPVISASTPGFKGDVYKGYEIILKSIIGQLPRLFYHESQKNTTLINILGVIPGQDPFWEGSLYELNRLLGLLNIQTNTLVGFGQDINSWKTIPDAALNLIVSPWGFPIAKYLEETYQTPYLNIGWFPVGTDDTAGFINEIVKFIPVDPEVLQKVLLQQKKLSDYHIVKIGEAYFKFNFQKRITIIGISSSVIGIARFLNHSFGQIISTVIITDNPSEELKAAITDILQFSEKIVFTEDGKKIQDILLKDKPEFILGSSLERNAANELQVPLLEISFPSAEHIILNKTYFGYYGALQLIEDFASLLIGRKITQNNTSYLTI